jgi:hypothetical protein
MKRTVRLAEFERLLGSVLPVKLPKPRRRRLTKAEVEAMVADGCLEYLEERAVVNCKEGRIAQRVLDELTTIPEQALAREALYWAEQLLRSNLVNGERIFRFLRARAPEQIGRAYALYRVYRNEGWAIEDLVTEYEWLREGDRGW